MDPPGLYEKPDGWLRLQRAGLVNALRSLGDGLGRRPSHISRTRMDNHELDEVGIDNPAVDYSDSDSDSSQHDDVINDQKREQRHTSFQVGHHPSFREIDEKHSSHYDDDDDRYDGITRIEEDSEEEDPHSSGQTNEDEQDEPPPFTSEDQAQAWDIPKVVPLISTHESTELCYAISRKIMKVLTHVFMIPAFLALLVLSKGSLLIATSNVIPYPTEPNNFTTETTTKTTSIFAPSTGANTGSAFTMDTDPAYTSGFETVGMDSSPSTGVSITTSPAVAQSSSYVQMICKSYEKTVFRADGNNSYDSVFKCVTIPWNWNFTKDVDFSCLAVENSTDTFYTNETSFSGDQCFVMRNYWIWSLFLMLCVPHAFVFLRSFWSVLFKREASPKWPVFFAVLVTETLHTVGVSLLIFFVLPSLNDAITALLIMLTVSSLPSLMKIGLRDRKDKHRAILLTADCLAFIVQLTVAIIWPLTIALSDNDLDSNLIWAIPLSLILTSVRCWENYFDGKKIKKNSDDPPTISDRINKLRRGIHRARPKILLVVSLWKIGITVVMMMLCVSLQVKKMDPLENVREMNPWTAVFNFDLKWCQHYNESTDTTYLSITYHDLPELELDWVWVWLVNCTASLIGYFFARSAAKMQMQRLCFSVPLVLTTPLMFGLMIGGCEMWNNQPCTFATNDLSGYLFYKCYEVGKLEDTVIENLWFLFPLWWLSQLWITWHVWFPKNERLASAEKLFVLPLYDGVLLEQSLLANRRRNDAPSSRTRHQRAVANPMASSSQVGNGLKHRESIMEDTRGDFVTELVYKQDTIPFIYICATMWHETQDEMVQMLKSIFRLDVDQASRRNAKTYFKIEDPDFYEFEAHIFFDNAFDHKYKSLPQLNEYVKKLLEAVTPAARAIHNCDITIPPPERIETPYGGRLIWTMPGKNKIIAHLKDSAKIRHKKRWSQVMYMYYFLGFNLLMDESLQSNPIRRHLRERNTFLLALDGDVDFEPVALQLVVDLMKRDPKVGAACGRIHPTGSGPMVWYQMFEYALGHWMQKATEHVIGCVLCSPGCFSLFRGAALLDDNVMAKYTTTSTEPMHFIQYDQGEDRWLCTLLLQKGYRVEYCAASDSFTNSPEKFEEFFNQRRRWMPSTMANVYDLLKSWRHTTKVNENISTLYIIYQTFLLASSIIGPGSIFMMMVGAMDIALGDKLNFLWSTILNLVPLLIFIILCYFCENSVQVSFAFFLTGIYILVQMLVLIGLIIQMADMGICFPTTIFFLFVTGTFIFCGIIHPQEILCVFHGFTYYLAIPTMYMLLMIYAICNLNNVSWGTREVKQTPSEKEMEEAKKAQEEEARRKAEKEKTGLMNSIFKNTSNDKEGWTIGCGSFCSYTCCPRQSTSRERALELEVIKADNEKMFSRIIENINDLGAKVVDLNNRIFVHTDAAVPEDGVGALLSDKDGLYVNAQYVTTSESSEQDSDKEENSQEDDEASQVLVHREEGDHRGHVISINLEQHALEESANNKCWIDDGLLGYGFRGELEEAENRFFEDLIKRYLRPIDKNPKEEERVAMELKDLRNQMSGAFFLLNAVFVVVIFVLQLNIESLYIPWPCGEDVQLEPLGFVFMLSFGVIMVIQIIGMVIHRTTTFLHVMSTTILRCGSKISEEEEIQGALEIARQLGRVAVDSPVETQVQSVGGTSTVNTTSDLNTDSRRRRKGEKANINILSRRPPMYASIDKAFEVRYEQVATMMNNFSEENQKDLDKLTRTIMGGRATGGLAKQRVTMGIRATMHNRQTARGTDPGDYWNGTNGAIHRNNATTNTRGAAYGITTIEENSTRTRVTNANNTRVKRLDETQVNLEPTNGNHLSNLFQHIDNDQGNSF